MKTIHLPFRQKAILGKEKANLLCNDKYKKNIDSRREKIISAAIAIEETLNSIIMLTMFRENIKEHDLILSTFLEADWCSFGIKRKIFNQINQRFDLVKGKNKSDLESNLSRVMKYRNAFAHGAYELNQGVFYLKYFYNKPIEQKLDDEFWEKIETCFMGSFNQLSKLEIELIKN